MIRLCSISVEYNTSLGTSLALKDTSLTIDEEFLAVVGPSGCGKTTLLRVLAGLIEPTLGSIESDMASEYSYGIVFQDYSLLPWLTARENVELGLKLRNVEPVQRMDTGGQLIHQLALDGAEHLLPHQLSGGMRQRVAIGRALAPSPPLLLMDEPFGALDAITRAELQELLAQLFESQPRTVIFVTHDVEEALFLADRVCVLTKRPGTIHTIITVPFRRPRQHGVKRDPEFLYLKAQIEDILRAEARLPSNGNTKR